MRAPIVAVRDGSPDPWRGEIVFCNFSASVIDGRQAVTGDIAGPAAYVAPHVPLLQTAPAIKQRLSCCDLVVGCDTVRHR